LSFCRKKRQKGTKSRKYLGQQKKNLGLFLPFFQLLLFFLQEETHRQNKWRGESFGREEKEDKNTDSIYSF